MTKVPRSSFHNVAVEDKLMFAWNTVLYCFLGSHQKPWPRPNCEWSCLLPMSIQAAASLSELPQLTYNWGAATYFFQAPLGFRKTHPLPGLMQ